MATAEISTFLATTATGWALLGVGLVTLLICAATWDRHQVRDDNARGARNADWLLDPLDLAIPHTESHVGFATKWRQGWASRRSAAPVRRSDVTPASRRTLSI